MSFRVFARGTGDYHHTRNYADEGDVYELADALGRIDSMRGGARGVIENEVTGAVPNSDGGLQVALNALGTLACVDVLETNFRLALGNSSRMTIFVAARSPSYFTLLESNASYSWEYTTRDYTPFRDFMQDLTPVLEEADLNRFRVLGAIAEVLGAWNGRAAPRGERLLNIMITDTD